MEEEQAVLMHFLRLALLVSISPIPLCMFRFSLAQACLSVFCI